MIEEFRTLSFEPFKESLDEESMGPAWRWLVLHEADTEDKMVAILSKNDRSLYHKVKAYEIAKIED